MKASTQREVRFSSLAAMLAYRAAVKSNSADDAGIAIDALIARLPPTEREAIDSPAPSHRRERAIRTLNRIAHETGIVGD
jgi:hypothetical protein